MISLEQRTSPKFIASKGTTKPPELEAAPNPQVTGRRSYLKVTSSRLAG